MHFEFEDLAAEEIIDLEDAPQESIRRLLAEVFSDAIFKAKLINNWVECINSTDLQNISLSRYVLAVNFMDYYRSLSSFVRSQAANEILVWLGVDPDDYWERLEELLEEASDGVTQACSLIKLGSNTE